MIFTCQPENDLYRVLAETGHTYPRYDTLAEALGEAPDGSGLLVLADAYPRPVDVLAQGGLDGHEVLDVIAAKQLRVYLEYPASLPGLELGEPRPTQWERVVVSSGFFVPALEPNTILAQHGCWFLPVRADNAHLVVARVAGYDRAVFGLPAESFPVLFELEDCPVMVATSKLSQFVRGRYAPLTAWKAIWEQILGWLDPAEPVPELEWIPTVGIEAGPDGLMHDCAEEDALRRSVKWFREHVVYSIDWKKGAIEGYESFIDHEGRQMPRTWARGDCTAETGMVFACDWALTRNPASRHLARQILDYVWSAPDFRQDDPDSPAYGLNNWGERLPAFYGDDNARVMLPTLLSAQLLNDDRWDEHLLRCLLANLRTTGRLGFRWNRIDLHHFAEDGRGWQFFHDGETVSYAPHYQAYLWACYLLAYVSTGYDGFLHRTKIAIRMTMEAYPNWKWTNGLTQEMARMLLPLAFLLRIEDTPQHRAWLDRIAGDLLAQMQPCGAIREKLGPLENASYAPPQSNQEYGTTEASLLQEGDESVCDLLYTTNYALLGLHEAVAATGDATLREAQDRLADFLCRIQVRSLAHPYLDGAWMRSFDYERWEYWGSSADAGWGAWSVEAGWTNAWIAAVFAMRRFGGTLFDASITDRLRPQFPALCTEMLGETESSDSILG